MTDQTESMPNVSSTSWGITSQQAHCPRCNWQYLLPADATSVRCPNCLAADLKIVFSEGEDDLPQPEMYIPMQVSRSSLNTAIQNFSSGLWFPPGDLTPENLFKRTRLVYLPVWLVDSQVLAGWRAEMGYNYNVVSHQDRYDDRAGGWRSREVQETRLRWEPRLGELNRKYENIAAPALIHHAAAMRQLGDYDYRRAQAFSTNAAFNAGLPWTAALPDRSIEDAWPDAVPVIQAAAQEECRQAAAADQVRSFLWNAEFNQRNWTLLLLPVLSTYYLDDEQRARSVLVNGQNGKLSGVRRASWVRARSAAIWLGIAAALALIAALVLGGFGMVVPPLLVVSGVLFVVGLVLGVGALAPLIIVWSVNKKTN